ncbi:NUDIX domain-containing protein [Streptomyces goshikiensis]|uniref:NUDIX domain-containing protein n=1 Tax=Streptomyces goshikiensis TaxID=1942 RepID=UPI00367E7DAA
MPHPPRSPGSRSGPGRWCSAATRSPSSAATAPAPPTTPRPAATWNGEDLCRALGRELAEELGLDTAKAEGGDLMWVIDQRVSRPGPTPAPRKLHLVYRFHIGVDVRATLAEQELDELPDGSHEVGVIEWIDYRETAGLPIFPPIGPALAALTDPRAAITDAALDAVTDANYTWV